MTCLTLATEQPPKKGRFPLLAKLAIIVVLAVAVAWSLSTDAVQRWMTSRRSTRDLEVAVRQAPEGPWTYYELGLRYARQQRLPEAVTQFERARQAAPDFADIRLALGKAYVFTASSAAAVPELRRAVQLDPRNAAAYRYLTMALRLTRNKAEALEAVQHAVDLDPADAAGWYQYGVLFTAADGDEDKGRVFLKKAVTLAPTDGVYAFAYGRSLADASQFGEAIPFLRRAVVALPLDPETHFYLGLCLHRNGKGGADVPEALEQLTEAAKMAPADFKAHFERGIVLEEEGKFADALPEFELSAKLNPNLGEVWFHLSRMEDRAGQRSKAEDARKKFTEIRRLHVEFTTLVYQLQADPTNSALQVRIAEVMDKQGRPKDAAKQYMDVLKREPENVRARALLENLTARNHWTIPPAQSAAGDGQ